MSSIMECSLRSTAFIQLYTACYDGHLEQVILAFEAGVAREALLRRKNRDERVIDLQFRDFRWVLDSISARSAG